MLSPADQWTAAYYANSKCRNGWECATHWNSDDTAAAYLTHARDHLADYEEKIAALALPPGAKILDIGSGPGAFAVPAAKRAAHVTAIEPAPGMRTLLTRWYQTDHVTNITCIPKRWEDVTVPELDVPYDLVLASFSLGMPDIRAALLKMHAVCSGTVVCYWQAAGGAWEKLLTALTPELFGTEYTPAAKSPLLLEILAEEQIPATLEVSIRESRQTFSSLDNAVDTVAERLGAGKPEQRDRIAAYLQTVLTEEDGQWHLPGITPPIGRLSWRGGWNPDDRIQSQN